MPSPFPGMNPYLESPQIWPSVHHRLIAAIADSLVPQVLPKYLVDIEKRVYQATENDSLLVGIPDVTVQKISNQQNSPISNVAVVAPPITPLKVRVPMLMEFREAYDGVYDRAAYNYIIDYTKQPLPALSEIETTWLETHLKEKTLR